jgi:hypothetical protein
MKFLALDDFCGPQKLQPITSFALATALLNPNSHNSPVDYNGAVVWKELIGYIWKK